MKQVSKLFKTAFKNAAAKKINVTDLHTKLGVAEEDQTLIFEGAMEISVAMAVKIEEALGIDAHQLLSAQAADQLETIGYKRETAVVEQRATGTDDTSAKRSPTDGQPKQGSMHGAGRSGKSIAVKL